MKNKSKILFLFLSVLIAVPAIIGLLHRGFSITDDGTWMVIRFSAFFQTLRSGQFPVRFLQRLNNGYGYPVTDFLYPLFMYLGVPLHILGFNFLNTIKVILVLSLIFSSVFCFLWLRKIFDNLASLVGAFFYVLSPYHLFDVYKRGSVGEALSLSIFPFILWQIERGSFFWAAIGVFLLILAHNTLAALFMPVIILYMAINILVTKEKKELFCSYLKILLFGLGLSAFFWLPAIYDLRFTVFSKVQISSLNNYFSGLNLVGLSTMFIFIFSFVLIFIGKIKLKKHRLTALFLGIGLISTFLAISPSTSVWNFLPTSFVQFPFRLLSITILCVAFLCASTVSVLSGKIRALIAGIFCILIIFSGWGYLFPQKYQDYPDSFYSTNQDTTTVKNEYMPQWVKSIPLTMAPARAENLNGETLNIVASTPNKIILDTSLSSPAVIQINTVYFPGWVAYVNGVKTNISYNNPQGLIRLNLGKGQNNVLVSFKETPVRLIADSISLISFLMLFIICYLFSKKKINL